MSAVNHFNEPVILFDGVCNLCEGFVQFILKKEKAPIYYFASLQSEFGRQMLTAYNLEHELKTVIFIKEGKAYTKSEAALEIAKGLQFPFNTFHLLKIFPRFIRDWVYDGISKRRYRWFGKKDVCMIPTPELKQRFLE